MTSSSTSGPHGRIPVEHPRDRFTALLFDRLWDDYRTRVSYVQVYERLIEQHGATFVNDHIAFRTIATQSPSVGIHSLSRIFEALGYQAAGTYHFADKHLSALHFQHPNAHFPKLFISELRTWELDASSRKVILSALDSHREPLSDELLASLASIDDKTKIDDLLGPVLDWFRALPWSPPEKNAVVELNRATQYGAWVLVHGYNVNHFTSLINSHGVAALDDLEKTSAALRGSGVPMKSEIEGEVGSKLRQTATEAAMTEVTVSEGGRTVSLPWTYAYFELAQRDWITDPATGRRYRFEGFLGPQATNLFEMTRVK